MVNEIQNYIDTWEGRCYPELPDEAPREIDHLVPSYRKIAQAILSNDVSRIGVTRPVSKYYGMYKRIELSKRSRTVTG